MLSITEVVAAPEPEKKPKRFWPRLGWTLLLIFGGLILIGILVPDSKPVPGPESAGVEPSISEAAKRVMADRAARRDKLLALEQEKRAATARQQTEELEKTLQKLFSTGLLKRFDVDADQAYVDPLIWAASNIDTKQGITLWLADYCRAKGSTGHITIYSYQSGAKLASYGSFGGFKTYQ